MIENASPRLRVLLLEDEGGIALLIEDMLEELGCEVVESAARISRAFDVASRIDIDFAVLDVNVGGENSFDFARALSKRDIPFVFSTGYGEGGIPAEFADRPILAKPFTMSELRGAVAVAAGTSPGADR